MPEVPIHGLSVRSHVVYAHLIFYSKNGEMAKKTGVAALCLFFLYQTTTPFMKIACEHFKRYVVRQYLLNTYTYNSRYIYCLNVLRVYRLRLINEYYICPEGGKFRCVRW